MKGGFYIGLFIGAAVGSVGTYFATRKMFALKASDAIESYAQFAEERIAKLEEKYKTGEKEEEAEKSEADDDDSEPEQHERVTEDVVIKKYHQYAPQFDFDKRNESMDKNVLNEVKENISNAVNEHTKKALERKYNDVPDYIVEVDSDEFLESSIEEHDSYERVSLDFLFPQNELYWGYDTDCQEEAETHYNEEREDLIGQCWRWATDYTDNQTGTGSAYIRNDKLKVYFEVQFHVDMELEATGEFNID